MKQVLLAIDGDIPTDSVFQYAVGLCRRIQAQLNILQFVKKKSLTQCISSTKKKVEEKPYPMHFFNKKKGGATGQTS